MQDKIFLCEKPHPVIQGEGNLIGKKMLLFRVSGCNVLCKDCDSKHSWKKESDITYSIEEFRDYINMERAKRHFDYVMITGGAPSLYKKFLYEIFRICSNFNFQIEDAGDSSWYDFRNFQNVYFSFSPKIGALQGSTNIEDWNAFNHLPINWICKIVVDKNNWKENLYSITQFQDKYNIPNNKIWLMPFGVHRDEIIEQSQFLIDKSFEEGFNFSPRLHVLIYDNKKLV